MTTTTVVPPQPPDLGRPRDLVSRDISLMEHTHRLPPQLISLASRDISLSLFAGVLVLTTTTTHHLHHGLIYRGHLFDRVLVRTAAAARGAL